VAIDLAIPKKNNLKLNCVEKEYLKESIATPFRAWNKIKHQLALAKTCI